MDELERGLAEAKLDTTITELNTKLALQMKCFYQHHGGFIPRPSKDVLLAWETESIKCVGDLHVSSRK